MSKVVTCFLHTRQSETCYIILGDIATNDSTISWWMDFLHDAGVGEGKAEREAIATRLCFADLSLCVRVWERFHNMEVQLWFKVKHPSVPH
jgi:hypothetical protein